MKNLLVLILATCVLGARTEPAAEAPKPAAVEKPAEPKPKIPPVNVRDELIELIHRLKVDARYSPRFNFATGVTQDFNAIRVKEYEVEMKEKTEAKHLLLQALVELAKEVAKDKPSQAWHSSSPPPDPSKFDPWKFSEKFDLPYEEGNGKLSKPLKK